MNADTPEQSHDADSPSSPSQWNDEPEVITRYREMVEARGEIKSQALGPQCRFLGGDGSYWDRWLSSRTFRGKDTQLPPGQLHYQRFGRVRPRFTVSENTDIHQDVPSIIAIRRARRYQHEASTRQGQCAEDSPERRHCRYHVGMSRLVAHRMRTLPSLDRSSKPPEPHHHSSARRDVVHDIEADRRRRLRLPERLVQGIDCIRGLEEHYANALVGLRHGQPAPHVAAMLEEPNVARLVSAHMPQIGTIQPRRPRDTFFLVSRPERGGAGDKEEDASTVLRQLRQLRGSTARLLSLGNSHVATAEGRLPTCLGVRHMSRQPNSREKPTPEQRRALSVLSPPPPRSGTWAPDSDAADNEPGDGWNSPPRSSLSSESTTDSDGDSDCSDEQATRGVPDSLQRADFVFSVECSRLGIPDDSLRHAVHKDALDASQFGLGGPRARAVAAWLTALPPSTFKSVDLSENRVSGDALELLLNAIGTQVEVTVLNLSGNSTASIRTSVLPGLLQHTTHLEELSLSRCALSDKHGVELVEILQRTCSKNLVHVDLSRNSLAKATMEGLIQLVQIHRHLHTLNLSSNNLRGEDCIDFLDAVSTNSILKSLSLGNNGLGDIGTDAAAHMLRSNRTLEHLDIAFNRMSPRSAVVLAIALSDNATLKTLDVSGNTLGRFGGRALLRTVLSVGSQLDVTILQCDFSTVDYHTTAVNPARPAGRRSLNLSDVYHRAVACEFVRLFGDLPTTRIKKWAIRGQSDVTLGRRFSAAAADDSAETRVAQVINEATQDQYVVPTSGVLEVTLAYDPSNGATCAVATQDAVRGLLRTVCRANLTVMETFTVLRAVVKDTVFSPAQATLILDEIANYSDDETHDDMSSIRATLAYILFPAVVEDMHGGAFIDQTLVGRARSEFALRVGEMAKFSIANPTAHYAINLGSAQDQRLMKTLFTVDVAEAEYAADTGRGDTSQNGTGSNIRNLTLNGAPAFIDATELREIAGTLEFDFVSTSRPPEGAPVLRDSGVISIIRGICALFGQPFLVQVQAYLKRTAKDVYRRASTSALTLAAIRRSSHLDLVQGDAPLPHLAPPTLLSRGSSAVMRTISMAKVLTGHPAAQSTSGPLDSTILSSRSSGDNDSGNDGESPHIPGSRISSPEGDDDDDDDDDDGGRNGSACSTPPSATGILASPLVRPLELAGMIHEHRSLMNLATTTRTRETASVRRKIAPRTAEGRDISQADRADACEARGLLGVEGDDARVGLTSVRERSTRTLPSHVGSNEAVGEPKALLNIVSRFMLSQTELPPVTPTHPGVAAEHVPVSQDHLVQVIGYLRTMTSSEYVTVDQAYGIISAFPQAPPECRVEAFVALFSRINDLTGACRTLLPLMPTDAARTQVCKRVGWFNVLDLLSPAGSYTLDLKVFDEREVASTLVLMSCADIDCTISEAHLDGEPFSIPLSWMHDMPHSGVLTVHVVAPAVLHVPDGVRAALLRKTLLFDNFAAETD